MRETSPLSEKVFDDIDLLLAKADELVAHGQRLKAEDGEPARQRQVLVARSELMEAREMLERHAEHVPERELAVIRRSIAGLLREMNHGTNIDGAVISDILARIRRLPESARQETDDEHRANGAEA